MPQFVGGDAKLIGFLTDNFKMPYNKDCYISKINFNFVVEKDGSLSHKQIEIKDKNVQLKSDKETIEHCKKIYADSAMSVLNRMPKWAPGKMKGNKVRVKYSVPLNFEQQIDFKK